VELHIIDRHAPSLRREAVQYLLRTYVWRARVVGAVGIALLGSIIAANAAGDSVTVLVVFGLYLVALALFALVWVPRRIVAQTARLVARSQTVPEQHVITPTSWRTHSAYGVADVSWRSFTGAVERRGQFLLMITKINGRQLPTDGLTTTELAQLRAFFAQLDFPNAPIPDWAAAHVPAWALATAEAQTPADALRAPGPTGAGLPIQVHAPADDTLRAEALAYILRSAIRRRRWFSILVLVLAAYFGWLGLSPVNWVTLALALVLVFLGFVALAQSRRAVPRQLRLFPTQLRSAGEYTVTDAGLLARHSQGWFAYRWELFTDAIELPGQILLRLNRAAHISLPTGGLGPQDQHVLSTFLLNRDWTRPLPADHVPLEGTGADPGR
jgi:hypothetical protein